MKVDLFEADYGDDLDWQIIAEPGDTISWKKARPLDEVPLPRDQTVMVKPGTFISAMWLDENDVERFEFAYVVAIREVAHSEDPGEPVLLVVSWLKTIRSTKEGVKPWMKKLDLDRSSMILSTEFDIIELDCVADIVTDETDENGTVFTYPLAESEQTDGLAIGLNCHRWYGRLDYFRSKFHNGKVRVETMPQKVEEPSSPRKRKAKESLAEPTISPKKSRVSPDADEPTDNGSPKKPVPRGRTMVLDSTTVTRRKRSPVATERSSMGPATARRSKVPLKPATDQEKESSETPTDATDHAVHLAALALEPAPVINEKKTADPDAMELDSPKTVSETDAEFAKKSEARARSADASGRLCEVTRATRASSAVPKSGLKVTFVGVDKELIDNGPLAPVAENDDAMAHTSAPENDVFMGYDTTNAVINDDVFGLGKLLPGVEEHAVDHNITLRKHAVAALSLPEVATPEKASGDPVKHDIRIMLQDPSSPDELSSKSPPKVNKPAPVKAATNGETIRVAPKPRASSVTQPNVGKKVTTESAKPDPKATQKENTAVPKKDTTKKAAVVNQADSKSSKTKTTSAPKNSASSATTFIDDQISPTKSNKKPITPKKITAKTAVDSPVKDQVSDKKVATVKKPTAKASAVDNEPVKKKVAANDPAAAKKTSTKGKPATAAETAQSVTENKATVPEKTDVKKQEPAIKTADKKTTEKKTTVKNTTVPEETNEKKRTSTLKPADEKAAAKKTTAPSKTAAKTSAGSAQTTKSKPATKESLTAQEIAKQKDEEEHTDSGDEDTDAETIARMERELAALKAAKAKRKSMA